MPQAALPGQPKRLSGLRADHIGLRVRAWRRKALTRIRSLKDGSAAGIMSQPSRDPLGRDWIAGRKGLFNRLVDQLLLALARMQQLDAAAKSAFACP